ncbi:MAG: hypothetical protein ACK5MF_04470 [Vibrio sp.]|uniref:hypothetical protein n=1 Tax=Vibrio sp. TaxID=678 RepID=UPI003A87DC49
MKPSKGNQFIGFVNLVCDQLPTSHHTAENIDKWKSLRESYCQAMNESRPDIYLQFWSGNKSQECESIEVWFDDDSVVKMEDDSFVLFEAKERL